MDCLPRTSLHNSDLTMVQGLMLGSRDKMYKARFKQWGLWKYTRPAEIPQLIRARTDRAAEQDQEDVEVFLNGKRVDFNKVDKYLRRRGWKRKQPAASASKSGSPSDSMVALSTRDSTPVSLSPPAEFLIMEDTFRAIRDYYDGCFSGKRWVSTSTISDRIFLATEHGLLDRSRGINEFHQRFKLAFRLLQDPARTGAEGMKMTRVCFAELPDVLDGEDPTTLYCILDIIKRLREAKMDFLVLQLLQYMEGLSTRRKNGRPHPMSLIWRNLLLGIDELGAQQTSRCAQIATSQFGLHLGEHHMKTIEAEMWAGFLGEPPNQREQRMRNLHYSFDQLETFDYRNLVVACNFANLLRKRDKLSEAGDILMSILDDPLKHEVLNGYPNMGYDIISILGKVRAAEGRLNEAEAFYRDAINLAKRNRSDDDSDLLDGLVFLEQCLRGQEKNEEADQILAEREGVIRQSLERVGEKENDV